MPSTATPRHVARKSLRVLCISAPIAGLIMAGWSMELLLPSRPYLVLMLFCTFLAIAVVAAIAAVLATCHLAIAQAFEAGVKVGRSVGEPPRPRRDEPTGLRVVE